MVMDFKGKIIFYNIMILGEIPRTNGIEILEK
jgi:hypothetical protein